MLHDHAREVLFESDETDLFELLKIISHKSVCQLLMRVIHKRQHLRNGDRAYKAIVQNQPQPLFDDCRIFF